MYLFSKIYNTPFALNIFWWRENKNQGESHVHIFQVNSKWTTLLNCSPASSLVFSRKQWWNGLWSHGQFGVHGTISSLRNDINLQTWSVIRGWTWYIIITTLLLLLGSNARVLWLYLGTSCLSFPSVLSSYDLLLPVSVNGDPILSLMPLRFTFSVIAYLYSLLKFLIKFSIFDIKKEKKSRCSYTRVLSCWCPYNSIF